MSAVAGDGVEGGEAERVAEGGVRSADDGAEGEAESVPEGVGGPTEDEGDGTPGEDGVDEGAEPPSDGPGVVTGTWPSMCGPLGPGVIVMGPIVSRPRMMGPTTVGPPALLGKGAEVERDVPCLPSTLTDGPTDPTWAARSTVNPIADDSAR